MERLGNQKYLVCTKKSKYALGIRYKIVDQSYLYYRDSTYNGFTYDKFKKLRYIIRDNGGWWIGQKELIKSINILI